MTDTSDEPTRRTLLKTLGAGAAASLGLGAGAGAASGDPALASSHCYYEYQCLELICPYQDGEDGGLTEQRRECCEDPDTGEVTCGDWEGSGCCSTVQ